MNIALLKRVSLFTAAALLLPVLSWATDLNEIYQRALRNDPVLREAEANRMAARETHPQALGALLPQVNANGSYTHDEISQPETLFAGTTQQLIPTLTKIDTPRWSVQLRQTLFRWDQLATLRESDAQVAQAEVDFRAAQQSLILRTATAYFNVLAARDTLDAAQASHEAISKQLEQSEKRFDVGLIAVTDVEEAKAAADQATATVIESKRALATTRDRLRELTGDFFDELARPGDDIPLIAPDPENEDQWVKTALDQNLNLTSARLAADIARNKISVAHSGHYPTIDIVASRSGSNTSGNTLALGTAFSADSSLNDKQISIQMTIPLYSGGIASSRVQEAVYRHRAARERLEQTARETERIARDSYLGVLAEISRIRALKQALASSTVALQATEAGYEVGTRTAVDVLLSRQRLFDAQTSYARSRYDYVINVLTLEQAAGMLNSCRLERVNGWLGQTVSVK